MAEIRIELPEDVIESLGRERAQAVAREALVVRLYDMGEIGSGKGAALLGISRREFLDLLGRYNVSEFDENMDIAAEAQRG